MKTIRNLANWTSNFATTASYPVLFVGHGNPMNAIIENNFTRSWNELGKTLPRPNAILCISAHWETKGTRITQLEKPKTIHDFGGFPKSLFQVQYPANGMPDLAFDIQQLLREQDARLDQQWGLDHGAWSVLKHIYPKADVPVIQLSLNTNLSPKEHYALAQELQILRNKGVLVIGSGNMVHNLGLLNWKSAVGYAWAEHANEIFKSLISEKKHNELIGYENLGTEFNRAIPSVEHYLPLLYTLALQNEKDQIRFFNDEVLLGSISMTSVLISESHNFSRD